MFNKKVIALDWDDTLSPLSLYRLYPGVKDFLDKLHADGYEIIIISGMADKKNILKTLAESGIPYIHSKVIYTATCVREAADALVGNFSDPKFRQAFEKEDVIEQHRIVRGYQKNDYLMLDDSKYIIKSIQESGYEGILVERIKNRDRIVPGFFEKVYGMLNDSEDNVGLVHTKEKQENKFKKSVVRHLNGMYQSLSKHLQFCKKHPLFMAIGTLLPLLLICGTIAAFILLNVFTAGLPTLIGFVAVCALGASGVGPAILTWGAAVATSLLSGTIASFIGKRIISWFSKSNEGPKNPVKDNGYYAITDDTGSYTRILKNPELAKQYIETNNLEGYSVRPVKVQSKSQELDSSKKTISVFDSNHQECFFDKNEDKHYVPKGLRSLNKSDQNCDSCLPVHDLALLT